MTSLRTALQHVAGLALIWSVVCSDQLTAQETRDELLQRARSALADFDVETALSHLRAAVDPALGARDTVWAQAVQLLAQTLVEERQEALASVWLRWVRKHHGILSGLTIHFKGITRINDIWIKSLISSFAGSQGHLGRLQVLFPIYRSPTFL